MHTMKVVRVFIALFAVVFFAVPSAYSAEYANPQLLGSVNTALSTINEAFDECRYWACVAD